jgi:hypothetical protein
MILQLTPTNRGIVDSPSRPLAAVWRCRMVDNTTALRGLQIRPGHPIRLSAERYTTMSNGASGRKNMPALEMDRLATEAMQCWADFQEGLSSNQRSWWSFPAQPSGGCSNSISGVRLIGVRRDGHSRISAFNLGRLLLDCRQHGR